MRGIQPQTVRFGVFKAFLLLLLFTPAYHSFAQPASVAASETGVSARPVTIPITIRVKGTPTETELTAVDLAIMEDGDPQTLLSIRAIGSNSPLNLMVLIQDDLVSSVGLEIKSLAEFIRRLPRGSRVAVGYIRTGTLQLRQKFTPDLERAAKSLRIPLGMASAAPYNPYVEVIEALRRFDSQPAGRRAILLVSDGLDISRGVSAASAGQSIDLARAINDAQRRSVAIYAFFAPTNTSLSSSSLMADAQGSLQRLSDETGGKAFFQGLGAPTSFDPFIKELSATLDRQIALTYLSTHPGKGFHRIKISSSRPDVDISFPSGYTRK